jgi:hypothetical protein
MPRIAFIKTTPEGLAVDVEDYEGVPLLLLTKTMPGSRARAAQIVGVACTEVNTPTMTWYYEYEPLPNNMPRSRLARWLENRAYVLGVFDQYGNFRGKLA